SAAGVALIAAVVAAAVAAVADRGSSGLADPTGSNWNSRTALAGPVGPIAIVGPAAIEKIAGRYPRAATAPSAASALPLPGAASPAPSAAGRSAADCAAVAPAPVAVWPIPY